MTEPAEASMLPLEMTFLPILPPPSPSSPLHDSKSTVWVAVDTGLAGTAPAV